MTRTWVGTITAFYVMTLEGLIIPLLGKVQSDTKGWGMKEKGGSDIRFRTWQGGCSTPDLLVHYVLG